MKKKRFTEEQIQAILKDSDGNVVDNFITSWTTDGSIGTFSDSASDVTSFKASNGSAKGYNITVDCNGITKRIPVTIALFSVTISSPGSNSMSKGSTKNFTATAKLDGQEYNGTVT